MQAIIETLNRLTLGDPATFEGLTLYPLFNGKEGQPDYITLDEALEHGFARVTEVSEGGSVPDLQFENRGEHKVLLVDGDELVGAKQNRVVNLSILVAGHAKLQIPVSCVERGRWSYRSREFSSAKRNLYAGARAAKMGQVTMRMKGVGERYADQSAVWNNIAECSASLDVDSATGAMADIYERHTHRLDDYRQAFRAQEGQVGAVFALNGQVQGLELFDSARTLRQYLGKLISSYTLEALASEDKGNTSDSPDGVDRFLEKIRAAEIESFAALGEGEDVRLTGKTLTGGALVAEDRVVHLSAFELGDEADERRSQVRRRHPWMFDDDL